MDLEQILLSTVVPAGISYFVALATSSKQKRLEFEYDYKKFILERRKKAYQLIEEILEGCVVTHFADNDRPLFEFFIVTKSKPDPLRAFNGKVLAAHNENLWLGKNMGKHIRQFNRAIVQIGRPLGSKRGDRAFMMELGRKQHAEMKKHIVAIRTTYFEDLIDLNDIERFKIQKLQRLTEQPKG